MPEILFKIIDGIEIVNNCVIVRTIIDEKEHYYESDFLSEVYSKEGQKGLDREIIRLLYSKAQLHGKDKSLSRYYYALTKARETDICNQYLDMINGHYYKLSEYDKTVLNNGESNPNIFSYKRTVQKLKDELYTSVAEYCSEYITK